MYKKNEKNHLAVTLRRLRVNAGFTQQNMADVLNINRSTYTYYETGKTMPDINSLKILSDILQVSIEVFLEGEPRKILEDSSRRRPKKKVEENPKQIGELSSKEKALIALLRAEESQSIDEIIAGLKKNTVEGEQAI